jgi:hypothetical protein
MVSTSAQVATMVDSIKFNSVDLGHDVMDHTRAQRAQEQATLYLEKL